VFGDYFERHEEQAFIAKAFLTIIFIILVKKYLSGLIILIFLLLPIIFLLYIRFRAATEGVSTFELLKQHITFIPVMYAEGERKKEVIPWVTYGIILVNVLIYYLYEVAFGGNSDFMTNNLVFLPHTPNGWNVVVSAFTSMFLHANGAHLWGNMVFLWALGTAVERRIGDIRFALLYLITGLFGGIVFVLVTFLSTDMPGHLLGASGAIAGIMGIFAVRCYFKSMVFPVPILGIFSLILPISLKVRLNSLVIIGLFFLSDLSGGVDQIAGTSTSMVGHWAHLGGMISGMVLAGFLNLGKGAVEERHLEIGIKAAASNIGYGHGEQSLRKVLENNQDNVEAILALARLKSKFSASSEGQQLYAKAIKQLVGVDPKEAAVVYEEYRKMYHQAIDADILYLLAGIYQRQLNLELATRCLESVIASGAPDELREKAISQLALLFDKMELEDSALGCYETMIREFPHSHLSIRAYNRLGLEMPAAPTTPQAQESGVTPQPEHVDIPQPQLVDDNAVTCPACSSAMQQRRANKGVHAGKLFLVCARHPECASVIPVRENERTA